MVTPLVIKLVIDIFAGGLINNGNQNKKILHNMVLKISLGTLVPIHQNG